MVRALFYVAQRLTTDMHQLIVSAEVDDPASVSLSRRTFDINPNTNDQISAYVQRFFGRIIEDERINEYLLVEEAATGIKPETTRAFHPLPSEIIRPLRESLDQKLYLH